ncbi:MAG: T9SS type A sorting domain-containing protein, partial [Bacteroidales bacterium]|nr:T9SS type A sorting domain-containing protein [Bacteroidales bacterium]
NVNLIAGHNIRMLEGTSVRSGAYLHAYISNEYCTLPPAMLAAEEDTDTNIETVSEKSSEVFENHTNDLFRVYPNPTTGIFTLELNTGNDSGSIKIEIFNLLGECILNTVQQSNSHYQFDLSGNKAGVYFIRVIYGENNKIEKLIKQ